MKSRLKFAGGAVVVFAGLLTPGFAAVAGKPFGKTPNGEAVELYTLRNGHLEAEIMTWGATLVSLRVPDANGHADDVVLGFDDAAGYFSSAYLKSNPHFGGTIGRYGNRIAGARFTLNGRESRLKANDGANTLHGGDRGFDKRLWSVTQADAQSIELRYISPDGEEGFPGKLTATVRYSLTPKDELRIEYSATTDQPTVQNLTNHSYFNLAGAGNGTVLDQQVQIFASRFTPTGASMIPTGELRNVEGTPLDFRKPVAVGARINETYDQLRFGHGYDQNFVIDRAGLSADLVVPAARVYDPGSGRVMDVLTTQPGVQFYTANYLDGTIHGKDGKPYLKRGALCFETQHYPDSPHQLAFPSTLLRPGDVFHSITVYSFSARR